MPRRLLVARRRWLDRFENNPRRGYLAVMGVSHFVLGLVWLSVPSRANGELIPILTNAESIIITGLIWLISGLVAFISSKPYGRVLNFHHGFFALQFSTQLVALYFFIAYIISMITPDDEGASILFRFLPIAMLHIAHVLASRVRSVDDIRGEVQAEMLLGMTGSIPHVPDRGHDTGEGGVKI